MTTDLASFGRLPPFALFDEFGISCDDRVQDHYHAEIASLQAQVKLLATLLDECQRALFMQIEPKHGPKAASEYWEVARARSALAALAAAGR